MNNTIFHLSQYALQVLKDSYPTHEIQSICRIIYMDVLHFTNIDIHLRKNEILDERFINKFYQIIDRLKNGEPLQYIIGETEFSGLRFKVNTSTLIPRPETAELVNWVSEYIRPGMNILDIGTGSGCIVITLAVRHPSSYFNAVDIDSSTLQIARENAIANHAEVNFLNRDILFYNNYQWPVYDLIVSNPPYIRESEKAMMHPNVLEHEPAKALFVSDMDPLLFYRKIAEFGKLHLQPQGMIFFEINEALGNETLQLLQEQGYRDVEIRQDIHGKDRMIKALL